MRGYGGGPTWPAAGRPPAYRTVGQRLRQIDATRFEVTGDLTVHSVSQPATVDFELTGAESDPRGGLQVGFKGSAIINRKDWGVSWGGLLIGEKVALELDVAVTRRS